ncbi:MULTISPECIES: entericidin A/B family lipoprotein [unclassified Cupriavidus]
MKKLLIAVVACIGIFQLAGCNTVAGFGKDTQAAGHALERAANK